MTLPPDVSKIVVWKSSSKTPINKPNQAGNNAR